MAEKSFDEKTEPATPKRLGELRSRGQVARSAEIPTAAVLTFGSLVLYLLSGAFVGNISTMMKDFLSLSYGSDLTQGTVVSLAGNLGLRFAEIAVPIVLSIMLIGVLSNVVQFGFIFTLKPLTPKGGSMNPLNGIKKLGFSSQALIALLKSILKIAVVGVIGYFAARNLVANSASLIDSSPAEILSYMGASTFSVVIKISVVFLVFALVDFYVQKKKFQHETRMTKQEVKEEHKQEEGNPTIMERLRREMVKMHKMRMMQAVPKADVVVTNPTHYAIAIKYDAKEMTAPKVVAKGKDLIAQKIKEVAAEHNIPIVEDKPLAQLLYKTVEIDEQIPPTLFKAVAQILAYIYQMKTRRGTSAGRGAGSSSGGPGDLQGRSTDQMGKIVSGSISRQQQANKGVFGLE